MIAAMNVKNVFVYEHIAGGGMADETMPMSLRVEGMAMLSAVIADLADIPGLSVTTTLDERLVDQRPAGAQVTLVRPGELNSMLEQQAGRCDVTIVIAPELEGLLAGLVQRLETVGITTAGSTSAAVALTTDKLETARRLTAAGVPTIPTERLAEPITPPADADLPVVLKPRRGAGSAHTYLITEAAALRPCLNQAREEGLTDEVIRQPFCPGLATSIALLVGPNQTLSLRPTTQRLSNDGRFRYHGGDMPLAPEMDQRAIALGRRAVAAIDGLRGYVGIDMILGDAADGSEDVVVEINPRMTTSYVGHRSMTPENVAEMWLEIAAGVEVEPPEMYNHSVRFTCDGRVRLS
jgi:hypothetical protein